MFKQISYNGKQTQYIICDDGVIYNTKTHKNLYGSKSNGYIHVQLTIDGIPKSFALHRLLGEYFIPNPENKEVIHHIDGNPENNKLENLMWLSQKENSLIKLNQSPKIENTIPNFTAEELEQEEWRQFRDTNYEISNLGRYKNKTTKKIYVGSQNKNSGYIRWNFHNNQVQAHRAVYEVFHPGEDLKIINHINGNRADNRLKNLENVTQSDNVKKAYYSTKTKKTICIGQYDLEGNRIAVYPSMAAAARGIGVANTSVVRNALLNSGHCKGYIVKEISLEEYKQYCLDKIDVT